VGERGFIFAVFFINTVNPFCRVYGLSGIVDCVK